MRLFLAGMCVLGLLAGAVTVFLLTIPAVGDSGLTGWRQAHEQMYRNGLELSAAVMLVALLILSLAAAWLIL